MLPTPLAIFTQRELFLLLVISVTYIALFVVVVQSLRRKTAVLNGRLARIRAMQAEAERQGQQEMDANLRRLADLEELVKKMGDENSMLRIELEEQRARLDYAHTMASIGEQRRRQVQTVIFGSDVYQRMKQLAAEGRPMGEADWRALAMLVDSIHAGFAEKLYALYPLSDHDYRVCLLIKVHMQPKEMAILTARSKEGIASTRSRLYQKVFGEKASPRSWDEFVLSL